MTHVAIRRAGGTVVAALSGDVDLVTAAGLTEELLREAADRTALVLDLSAVTFLDSAGVRLVDTVTRDCAAQGTPLRVVAPPGGPPRLALSLCSYPDSLLAATTQDALAAVG